MNASLSFWIVFLVLIAIVWYCDHAFNMLRDASTAVPKPFSFARVQLAWWTVVIFSSFISILFLKGHMPVLDNSTLVLLGISAGTTTAARLIDQSDQQKLTVPMGQDLKGENFLLDILSDKTGVNVHRLQAVILNLTFGIYIIHSVLHNLSQGVDPDLVIPVISNNDLVLLGLSSGTYAALKTSENKEDVKGGAGSSEQQPEFVPDESGMRSTQAAG